MQGRILVVDDDKLLLGFMEEHLSMNNYDVVAFNSPVEALSYLEKNRVDLVVSDVKMNEMTGDEVMNHINRNYPDTGVILITGFGSINHSVNAIRKGAFDYVTKPFTSREILYRVNRFFETAPEERRAEASTPAPSTGTTTGEPESGAAQSSKSTSGGQKKAGGGRGGRKAEIKMVGQHPHIRRLLSMLPQIARNNAPILIQGESGTGKEVYAHLIHHESDRASGPYLKINCANLPSELVESTLFGHMKGSFTGATSDRKGAFDEADGGTLLLDEITEIDINIQAKLLRVLQEKEFQRVGSQKPVKVDVRVIATTNRQMTEAIAENQFREDLYYRLNVFPITIPPLRERRDDIPMLAQFFIDRYTSQYDMGEKTLSKQLADYLMEQEWKGNVRELDNKIHRGVILSQKEPEISIEHVEDHLFSNVDEEIKSEVLADIPLIPIEEMELQMIKKALEKTRGNQKKAGQLLGISDRTIRNKLKNSGWTEEMDSD
ncbi:sigma-54 dependent transcriptional regulator [Balneolales bacterium ANBcel1]|nr:sigma-54 dependent transcriptional regulator [Balneolales bacterium ANBcel1]